MLLCLPLLSQQLQLCASPPLFFRVFGVSFHPPGFLLRLLSCAPSTLYSTWVLFFFLVSFPWFWVSLSRFLLLSPLLEPSLLFFLLSVRSLLGGVAVTPPKKKWVRGVVCRGIQIRTLTVIACVILQCIPCFYECRCMSDGVLIQFVRLSILW